MPEHNYSDRNSVEFAYKFIKFLKKYDFYNNIVHYDKECEHSNVILKSLTLRNYVTFTEIICELFYKAMNSIPEIITQYTITCTTNKMSVSMVLGVSEGQFDSDGDVCIAKIVLDGMSFILSKNEINSFYIYNRTNSSDDITINRFMNLLYMDEQFPIIKTSYISTKRLTKW